jgi:predicted dehydrogenase
VFVTTPTGSHAALAGDCVEAGKHLFVEKPLATTLAEAEQVAATVERRRLRSQVGYVCRYSPTFEKAREVLLSGALGRVRNFGSVKYSSDVLRKVEKSWRFLRKTPTGGGGGVVNEFSCHGVDLLVWFFGEPRGVESRLESWYSEEVEDHVHSLFDYGDFSGWFDSSWSMQDYRKPYNRIEITAENGRLMVTDSEVRWLVNKAHQGMPEGWHSHSVTDLYRPVRMFVGDIMFSRQAEDFISRVKEGGETRSPAAEALRTQRVLEAMHQGEKR